MTRLNEFLKSKNINSCYRYIPLQEDSNEKDIFNRIFSIYGAG